MRTKLFFTVSLLLLLLAGTRGQDILLSSITVTDVTCGGISDGTITIEVTGGDGNLNYTLLDQGYAFLESSGFIADRTYTFDFDGGYPKNCCYSVLVGDMNTTTQNLTVYPVAIGGPDPISIDNAFTTNITCAGTNNGTITVTASGEQELFRYDLSGPVPGFNFNGFFDNLPAGTYQVTVSDQTGTCSSTDVATNLIIDTPLPLTINVDNVVNVACFGELTGAIDITASGGTPFGTGPAYTYSWTSTTGFTSTDEDPSGLEAGDYEVTVTDANGCTLGSGTITVGTSSEIEAALVSSTDVRCYGGNDGSVTIIPSGGTPLYSFSWDGQSTSYSSSIQNPNNMPADTYDLTITDGATCVKVFPGFVTIDQPDPISMTIEDIQNVRCFGGSSGEAAVTVTGGTGTLVFEWTGPVGYSSSQEDPSSMPAGVYTLSVDDANLCNRVFTDTITITEPQDITAVRDGFSDVSCNGGNDGTVQVTVSNGTPGYSYLWTGDATGHNSTAEDPVDLIADRYDLQITDANGCMKTFDDFVTIGQPDPITISTNITHVLCNGESTGAIEVTPAGGTPAYSYEWIGPGSYTASTRDISGLAAGSYTLTITDAQDCEETFNVIVTENNAITSTFAVTNLNCNGNASGAIDAEVTGGVAPYLFAWAGNLGYTNNTEDISGLDADTYTLSVTDDAGCFKELDPQTVTEPDPLVATFTFTDVKCFSETNGTIDVTAAGGTAPYFYTWTGPNVFSSSDEDLLNLAPGAYSLLLEDDNGCSVNYFEEVTINEPPDITAVATSTNVTCAGNNDGTISLAITGGTPDYTVSWTGPGSYVGAGTPITALEPGSYNATVTDANTCEKVFNNIVEITEPLPVSVTINNQTDLGCFGGSDGSIDVSISGGVPPYTLQWTDTLDVVVSTDSVVTGLTAGRYTLEVTDDTGCFLSLPDYVTLTQPEELLTSLSKTDVLCNGDATGTITAASIGGTPPYEYSLMGGPFDTNTLFTGLSKGTYNIRTQDNNGCERNDIITINEPSQLQFIDFGVSGQILCFGDSTATININLVTGGTPPYEYSIDGGLTYQSSGTFTNLPAGDYPVRVMDSNGCVRPVPGPTGTLSVDQPNEIKITFYDQVDITSCYDAPEGEITIIANGGTGNINYSLDNGTPQMLGQFTNIVGGFHDIQITDENACEKDTIVELLRPEELIIDQVNITDVTGCPGNNNGEIEIVASGGTTPYKYSINGIDFFGSNTFNNLTAGEYTLYIKDKNDCLTDTTVTVTEPAPIDFSTETTTAVSCNGLSDGEVIVAVTGGTTPYTFTLDPPLLPSQNDGTFSGLPAGDYTVSVDDAAGCGPFLSALLTITQPPKLVLDSVITDHISCNNANDALIEVYVSGGTPPYNFSVNNGATYVPDSIFTGLSDGSYEVWVMDDNGCMLNPGTYTFTNPSPIILSASTIDVAPCAGDLSGAISASATGGWDSFTYSINGTDFQVSGDFTGLAAGDYTVFTRDTGTCSASVNVTIDEPDSVKATVTKTDYVGSTLGTITISNATGGTPPYEFAIDGPTGTFSTETVYVDLVAGTYDVVVRDGLGCLFQEQVIIYDILPLSVTINFTDVSCFGADDGTIEFVPQDAVGEVRYSIDSGASYVTTPLFENLPGDSTYYLHAFDADGKEFSGSVTINEPSELTVSSLTTQAECSAFSETGAADITISGGTGAYSVEWSNGATTEDLNNVVAGTYYYTITDDSGCELEGSLLISSLINVVANAGKDTTVCEGATIELYATAWNIMQWDPPTYLSNVSIENPIASNITDSIVYTYTVSENTSPFGCYDIDTLRINVLPNEGLEITADTIILEGESIGLEVLNGTFDSFLWTPSTGLDADDVPDPTASPVESITYILDAINSYGCPESDTVLVNVLENLQVYNVFSPNGDGTNEYFEIQNGGAFPEILVEVFNRWGTKVFSSVGYTDDKRWDGTVNGKDAPVGTYYYVIILQPGSEPITGNVTIIR
jgi:gliding motility-associated-like protein